MCKWKRIVPFMLALVLLAGCGQGAAAPDGEEIDLDKVYLDAVPMMEELEEIDLEDEAVALAEGPAAISTMLLPEASGKSVKRGKNGEIDYSNASDGYVMVRYTAKTANRLKVQVFGPTTEDPYKYDVNPGEWVVFPLSDGEGDYKVTLYERNPASGKYAAVVSASFKVELEDEFAPFVRPNQYVDYTDQKKTLAQAEKLVEGVTDPLKKVEKVYDYVVKNLTYDKEKAKSVQSGYLPVLDDVLAAKKGICFDYAALMAGMLRSQGVPCKLVTGFVPVDEETTSYHAWISVWSEETGWVDGAIYFDGTTWHRMDPTFASSSKSSASILKYIGDGSNYSVKYVY